MWSVNWEREQVYYTTIFVYIIRYTWHKLGTILNLLQYGLRWVLESKEVGYDSCFCKHIQFFSKQYKQFICFFFRCSLFYCYVPNGIRHRIRSVPWVRRFFASSVCVFSITFRHHGVVGGVSLKSPSTARAQYYTHVALTEGILVIVVALISIW